MARIVVRKGGRFRDFYGQSGIDSVAVSFYRGENIYIESSFEGHYVTLKGYGFTYDSSGNPIGGVVNAACLQGPRRIATTDGGPSRVR